MGIVGVPFPLLLEKPGFFLLKETTLSFTLYLFPRSFDEAFSMRDTKLLRLRVDGYLKKFISLSRLA